MNDKVFLDTNILVYSYSESELYKQNVARELITDNFTFISTQVLQELTNVFVKKFKVGYPAVSKIINECCENSTLVVNDKKLF